MNELLLANIEDKKAPYSIKSRATRVFVSIEGETFLEDFGNRTSRPQAAWRPFVEAALTSLGYEFGDIRWSQNAGCSMCPCSPGFIVPGPHNTSIWITLRADEPQVLDPEEADSRKAQLLRQL